MRLTHPKLFFAVVAALVVLAGGATWLLTNRPKTSGQPNVNAPQNLNAADAQFQKDLDAFARADWRGALDDRIELIGGSLINVPTNVLSDRIAAATSRKTRVSFTERMTTRQAISTLSTMLKNRPPDTIVLDVGRYDALSRITTKETEGNLSAIVTKSDAIGIRVVVIGGIGADGNTDLATIVRPAVAAPAVFVDASMILQDSALRESIDVLNEAGASILAEQVIRVIAK